MDGKIVLHTKYVEDNKDIVEMKIWSVEKIKHTPYEIKYSLVYIKDGKRVLGYDNYERKYDHRHYYANKSSYVFTSVDQLIKDFLKDLEEIKKEKT